MSPTELQLLAAYRSPVVRLDAICEQYLNLPIKRAAELASLNALGLPTFRMSESRKAPRLVRLDALAAYIDERSAAAKAQWETSQV